MTIFGGLLRNDHYNNQPLWKLTLHDHYQHTYGTISGYYQNAGITQVSMYVSLH